MDDPPSLQAVYCTVSFSVTAGQYTHSVASTPAPFCLTPSCSASLPACLPLFIPYLAAYSPAATPVSGSAWHSCCSCWPWATLSGPCLPTHEGMLGFYSATEASTCDYMMLQGYMTVSKASTVELGTCHGKAGHVGLTNWNLQVRDLAGMMELACSSYSPANQTRQNFVTYLLTYLAWDRAQALRKRSHTWLMGYHSRNTHESKHSIKPQSTHQRSAQSPHQPHHSSHPACH